MSETSAVTGPLVEAANYTGQLVAWRNNTGGRGRLRWGVGGPGAPDIIGIHIPTGRMWAVEAKTESGVLSEDQKRWRLMALRINLVYLVCSGPSQIPMVISQLLKDLRTPL